MGVNKEGSTNGRGYVGGFFQLLDWTAKTRKKLFSSNFPVFKTGKEKKKEDETGARMSFKGSSDYSCASSVTDDDMYGAKAPSVVARLMGLDSLPTSSYLYSTPFFETQSLRDAHFHNRNLSYHRDEQIVYPDDPFNKIKGSPLRNFADSKPRKMDAARIMEAAARILDRGPQVIARAKMPLVRSSTVPVEVRDFKEKMEAAQRKPPVQSSCVPVRVRDLKEKSEAAQKTSWLTETKSWNGLT
ncbi:Detected protein of unknown function [Hibiscus syriacus]|uniref:DUF3741 domain-containing protein n=1 Tax=Hibiscus syriacus TaxID=106335 RepID=A0A6A3CK69_HIBSY|nr:Detected protein of unknown function [Hibiscus syriacus]